MTMPATAQPFSERLPTDSEKAVAGQLRQIIAATAADSDGAPELRIQVSDGRTEAIVLSPSLSGVLLELLRHIAKGESVSLVPMGEMLTTQQAADILNVSRPYLIKLVESGAIPHSLTGRHRRIRAADLFDYKRKRDQQRSDALSALAEMDGDRL